MNVIAIAMAAILWVESHNGTDLRHGDGGRAKGPYQMWTVAVDEANRIERKYAARYGRKPRVWRYRDRTDPVKSREMCEITLIWHYRRGNRNPIDLACRWRNPYSRNQPHYRQKIKKAIEERL